MSSERHRSLLKCTFISKLHHQEKKNLHHETDESPLHQAKNIHLYNLLGFFAINLLFSQEVINIYYT